jgi:hypothetical protein
MYICAAPPSHHTAVPALQQMHPALLLVQLNLPLGAAAAAAAAAAGAGAAAARLRHAATECRRLVTQYAWSQHNLTQALSFRCKCCCWQPMFKLPLSPLFYSTNSEPGVHPPG